MAEHGVRFARGFSLHEALTMIEDDDINANITLLPPKNACDILTDEDSGEENNFDINNFPPSQMQSEIELSVKYILDSDWETEDELPLVELQNIPLVKSKKPIKKKKIYHYVREDLMPCHETFEKSNGDDIPERTPASLFSLFFDEHLLQTITNETNRYASQKNKSTRVDVNEIKCFVGVLLLSGYIPVPRRRMFWERFHAHNELVSQAISRNKFEFILSNIHFQDNNTLDKSDKFSKIRPLFTHLNKKFLDNAYIEEEHSIDEAMVPYTGRHGCKQYIHGKPIRYGFKLWVGTTRLGYINWFEPYQGAATNISTVYKDLGVGTSVVLEYADVLRRKWDNVKFHLFFDNFFTSVPLLEKLLEKNMYGSGTIRENRIPGSILRDSKAMKKDERGVFDYMKIKDNNIIFIKWHDNNIVSFGSNRNGVQPLQSVKRYSQKEKKIIQVNQPHVVKLYNKSMGGVDRSDQNISLYRTAVRGKKWYFPLICHSVDMAAHNAWQIHRKYGGTMDQLSFRIAIADVLLKQNKKEFTYQRGRISQTKNVEVRFDRLDHLVIPQEKQTRCGHCHQKTTTRCQKCDIGVHVKCFVVYHTQ